MRVCSSAKDAGVWGILFATFSILWRPLTRLFFGPRFSAIGLRNSSHSLPLRASHWYPLTGCGSGTSASETCAQGTQCAGASAAWYVPAGLRGVSAWGCMGAHGGVGVFESLGRFRQDAFHHNENVLISLNPPSLQFPHRKSTCLPEGFIGLQAPRRRR